MLVAHIDPVAFYVFSWPVHWYGLMYCFGIWGSWYYARQTTFLFKGLRAKDLDDLIPWLVLGVVLGGRLGHVLFYDLAFFKAHPELIFQTQLRGMAFHGGLLGVALVWVVYARVRQIPLASLADCAACAVPLALCLGRIGNFINQEVYGHVTAVPWGVIFPFVDAFPRHPSQLYEAFAEGIVLFLLLRAYMTSLARYPWALTGLFLTGYAAARSICEFFRVPDGLWTLGGVEWTQGQMLSLPMMLLGLCLLSISLAKSRR